MATLASKSSLGQRPTQRTGSRGRQPSLRHVKNSTEVLRQRSQKRANQDVTPDGNSEGRKGRHFTVANVGNNGKIYLRPTAKPVHKTQASPFAVPDKTSHGPAHKEGGTLANVRTQGYSGTWSETQLSQTPTRARSIGRGTQRSMSATRDSLCRRRTISMSTIDGHLGNNSPTPTGFKIIIDQAGTLSKGSEKASLPTLEVPIPHYRLGTPRFSTRGTAFLHSSVYTRNSTNEDLTSSALSNPEFDGLFPVPPGTNNPLSVAEQQPQLSTEGHSIRITPVGPGPRSLALTSSPAVHRTKDPIVPEIYDSLSQNPDDPAIVRYSPGTREITAASPARIIAQVTSASFLDYELLSDFFLTVRAYLSTHDLLAYLLARFEWAINRFDDDGRVIRVRAFAALRHWILNYFPYDFVVDRELRVRFCDRLNTLLREVQSRSGSGPSDLKLILDLKKCWNGRCALYWDRSVLESSGPESSDIHPGGIAGSRDSQLTHPSQLWTKLSESTPAQGDTLSDTEKSAIALNKWFEGIQQAEMNELKGHERHVSSGTTRSLPTSPTSDQSIQALSCTLPAAALKKLGIYHGPVVHPVVHPVPTPPPTRRVCPAAPSALANEDTYPPKFGHKRSGSFSDAVRDKRTSLPSINVEQSSQAVEVAQIFQGSLIRGTVIPPGPPYIDIFAPTSPVSEMPDLFDESSEDSEDSESYSSSSKLAVPSTPGVRNIFGSIRRALSGKQLGYSSFNVASSDLSIPQMVRLKHSISPVARSRAEEANLEKRRHDPSRQHARIDLLCADTIEMFQRALMQASSNNSLRDDNVTPRPNSGQPNSHAISDPQLEVLTRNQSEVTYGSRSIPIVDDTRPEVPVPKVPSEFVVSASERLARLHGPELHHLHSADTSAGQATKNPPPVSSEVRPSPLARLSNAVAVAERVLAAPVENQKPPGAATLTGVSESEDVKQQEIKRMTSSHRSRTSATTQERSFRSTHSGAQSLRKYASFQSGITRTSSDHNTERVAPSVASPHSTKDAFPKPPGRMLRRRPGGDLRANENVHDLESVPRRSRSVGSITTCTESLRGSEYNVHRTGRHAVSQRSSQLPQSAQSAPPESQPSQAIAGKPVSLVRTHSSQPALRPSFEAAVAEFARIPDDEGGDIEATLLKLEGKYQKKSPPLNTTTGQAPQAPHVEDFALSREPRSNPNDQPQRQKQEVQNIESDGGVSFPIPPDPQLVRPIKKQQSESEDKKEDNRPTMTKTLYAESEELMYPFQHLEQGSNSDTTPKQPETNRLTQSNPRPSFGLGDEPATPISNNSVPQEPESEPKFFSRGARCRSSIPTTTDSFLLDEDEFLSDLSSELSEDTIEPDDDFDYPYGSAAQLVRNENRPPKIGYLLGYPTHPPTPPMTQETAKAINSQAKKSQDSRKPPTPDPSPVSMPVDPSAPKPTGSTSFSISTQNLSAHRHIPFILAYDSRTLAEQFTIIERDAVNEINWQDLIDMRWHHNSPSTLNWVDFLRTQDPTGIELVTSRFNLMVKWTLSEIVLTQNIEERALAIIKFIHIAKHARKNHNFALLLQLTIALTSVDCSRLTKTWDLVPPAEKRSLKDLETLVTPIKNFHNLRQEMETVNAEEGCIPVIALYIHDLTYNSQKPSQILNTRDGEPLVNFERYRTTASIVKSLLRLIDASSKYSYQPVEGALDRCLWMASLSDEMIRLKSKELE